MDADFGLFVCLAESGFVVLTYCYLNNNLLHGPDLTNTLLGVLIRFRQDRVALHADIEAMFHQVRVIPNHYTLILKLCFTK